MTVPIAPLRTLHRAGMTILVFGDAGAASRTAAEMIRDVIFTAVQTRDRAVIGLATGATPQKVYTHLAAMHAARELSFRNVVTYNLDEYYPIQALDPKSYRSYMYRQFFSLVDLPPNQTHMFDGTVPHAFAAEHCAQFDRWIAADGGLDLQLLGIGRNGHIGFNEPSELALDDALVLPSRLVELHPTTKADTAREFGGAERVPRPDHGRGAILTARSILMLATGVHKAEIVAGALNSPMTPALPASLLQSVAGQVTWMLDEPAANLL